MELQCNYIRTALFYSVLSICLHTLCHGGDRDKELKGFLTEHPIFLCLSLIFSWFLVLSWKGLSHNPQLWQMLTVFYLPPGFAKTVTFTLVSSYLCFLSPLWIRVATKWNLSQQESIGKQLPSIPL